MNQRHSQNITRVSVDVNLMVRNMTREESGIMIGAIVNVKKSIKYG